MKRIEIERSLNESRKLAAGTRTAVSPKNNLRRPLTPSEHDPHNMWSALDHFVHLALIERKLRRYDSPATLGSP